MQEWTPEDLKKHLDGGDRVFLKLWKKGCGACKLSTPALERIEASDTHGLIFGQISTDDHPEMFELTGTEVLPYFVILDKDGIKGQLEGFKGLERMKSFVEESCL